MALATTMSELARHQRTIAERQRALMYWYRRNGRHRLPWRKRITPYRVLVSEVMLQQTQVDRVIPYFTAWMKRWPTMHALARAKRASVIRVWAGLGYNRRAVNLHRTAQEIVAQGWPAREATALQRLPGIGSYTAHALLAFAWNVSAPCVDTNVRRVLAYVIYRRPAIMCMSLREVERLAARVMWKGGGRDWNYALMDYGALVFTAHDVPARSRPRPAQGRFKDSSRFWRGRIVAVLRTHREPCSISAIRRALRSYGTPPSFAPLIRALERDGILKRLGRTYHLA